MTYDELTDFTTKVYTRDQSKKWLEWHAQFQELVLSDEIVQQRYIMQQE
jgi:hypothetical protein